MLDFRFVAENIELIEKKCRDRRLSLDLTPVKEQATKRKNLIRDVEALKARKNTVSAEVATIKKAGGNCDSLILEMRETGDKIKEMDSLLSEVEEWLSEFMFNIPNLVDDSVPIGKDAEDNKEVRKFLEPTKFSFKPLPHWEIGEKHDILSASLGARIAGARFTVYKGMGAKLERAIINLMLDTHGEAGYTEIFPPFLANRESMIGTGQLPKFEEDMFRVANTNFYLVPTAEVPVTNLFRNDIIDGAKLPIKYTAYTACFRAEAGSAGRDTRGLIRQHQFNKVELVKFAHPDESFKELESLTADAEKILKLLKLPYRVVMLCSGDTGFSSCKTYDLEVYMPSYERYVEISSCSNFVDFQARRANIKFRDESGKLRLAHTLNGSGLAVGRTVAAILENYQQADGSVIIPEVLRKYVGAERI